ncbi:MAG: chemotaxis response regulator protein-glutamate methylesterase [Chloroflexi bacterium]|nr:chemotaxis response regulator protein-glutamate methylesterase [Chloroflexota bacterium]
MAAPLLASSRTARVLIVDDSAFMRRTLERMINAIPGCTVVGTAADGVDGVRRVLELRPDVVTMDVEMPKLDGVSAVTEIMKTVPTPVVMVSTLTALGTETAIRALEAGAVECVAKPSGLSHDLANVSDQLAQAIVRASAARVRRAGPASLPPRPAGPRPGGSISTIPSAGIVVIGSSTGGPPALTEVVPHLPASLGAGVVVVQHMPAGFTSALSRRLDALSNLAVREAADGDVVAAGLVLVAPGDHHLVVGRDKHIRLNQRPPLHGVRPAVDVTLESVADAYGRRAVAVILTGMGKDGAEGAASIERASGRVIVQDEASSVVYGMPRVAKERTRQAYECSLEHIAAAIVRAVSPQGAVI